MCSFRFPTNKKLRSFKIGISSALFSFQLRSQCDLISIMLLKGTYSDANHLFAANFLLILFGSAMITINAKLVGVKYSVFFYVCVLGSLTRIFPRSLFDSSLG